jgi:hypothetical protein
MTPIAETIEEPSRRFTLFLRPDSSRNGWLSLKLSANRRDHGRKRNWWLGWNGQRLARNHDAALLFAHHLEIYLWLLEVLDTLPPPVSKTPQLSSQNLNPEVASQASQSVTNDVRDAGPTPGAASS